jgi:hypothetical protein
MATLSISIQHNTGMLASAIRQEKERKGIQIGKKLNCPCLLMT